MNKSLMTENEIETNVDKITSQYQNHTQHMFIDITGDLVSGTLLSQILYWFTKDKNGNSKVRIFKDGHYWIAKNRDAWYDEIRITKRQYDTAINLLSEKNFVILAKYKYNSMPTIHIRPNYDTVNFEIKKWKNTVRKGLINGNVNAALREEYENNFGKNKKSKRKRNGNNENVNSQNDENVNSGNNKNVNTGITNDVTLLTINTNNDYNSDHSTNVTTINAFTSIEEVKGDIYAFERKSTPQNQEKSAPKVPYIDAQNFTWEELHEHIYARVTKLFQKHGVNDQEKLEELCKIIEYFYRKYDCGWKRYTILSDKALEGIVVKYLYPSYLLAENDVYSFAMYKKMIDKYFNTDFGKNDKNGYGTKVPVELSLPHFMDDAIRESMAMNSLDMTDCIKSVHVDYYE